MLTLEQLKALDFKTLADITCKAMDGYIKAGHSPEWYRRGNIIERVVAFIYRKPTSPIQFIQMVYESESDASEASFQYQLVKQLQVHFDGVFEKLTQKAVNNIKKSLEQAQQLTAAPAPDESDSDGEAVIPITDEPESDAEAAAPAPEDTFLHGLARTMHIEWLSLLLSEVGTLMDEPDIAGNTLLHAAVIEVSKDGAARAAKISAKKMAMLLVRDFDFAPLQPNKMEQSALQLAKTKGMVRALLENTKQVLCIAAGCRLSDELNSTPLHLLAQLPPASCGDLVFELSQKMFPNGGAENSAVLAMQDKNGRTPLHMLLLHHHHQAFCILVRHVGIS